MQENRSLKILRAKFGLTQEEMAEKLGMSRQSYAKIENGLAQGSISFWSKVQRTFYISNKGMWDVINGEAEEPTQV